MAGSGQLPIVLGTARDCMVSNGKWHGRPTSELTNAVTAVISQKRKSKSGTVTTLNICPINGSRAPCDMVEAKQSIVGDCQCKEGSGATRIKNDIDGVLGAENILVESLLAAVSVGDEDIVREMVHGAKAPRIEEVWATGDNVYVSGLDMSWSNLKIGDLLVMPNMVIVNQGYPHSACWKYAVRAGEAPKEFINSKCGMGLRLRGIKGSVIMPSSASPLATLRVSDSVRIVSKGTSEHSEILQDCRPPLEEGAEVVFRMDGKELRAAWNDIQAYVDLLITAGCMAARIDITKYKRELPDIMLAALGLTDISGAALSGDGTAENVGIKVDGTIQCPECRQMFDDERSLQLHWRCFHDPDIPDSCGN